MIYTGMSMHMASDEDVRNRADDQIVHWLWRQRGLSAPLWGKMSLLQHLFHGVHRLSITDGSHAGHEIIDTLAMI